MSRRPRDAGATRSAILHASYDEFHRQGFHGGSLNRIVDRAEMTKGALFHHFPDKASLAHGVVDERFRPELERMWLAPLAQTNHPIDTLRDLMRSHVAKFSDDGPGGTILYGCPIANLASEMAPSDEILRGKLDHLYADWRTAISDALERGKKAGIVHHSIDAKAEAVFLVGSLTGAAVQAKVSREIGIFKLMLKALDGYLETLRAPLK